MFKLTWVCGGSNGTLCWDANFAIRVQFQASAKDHVMLTLGKLTLPWPHWPPTRLAICYWGGLCQLEYTIIHNIIVSNRMMIIIKLIILIIILIIIIIIFKNIIIIIKLNNRMIICIILTNEIRLHINIWDVCWI